MPQLGHAADPPRPLRLLVTQRNSRICRSDAEGMETVWRPLSPCVVMEILGHSQIALTMNTYSHVAPEVSREAADLMAGALWHDEDQADDD